ncbi:2OG-Fe(II) oxygenase [Actinokineospora inagensis]|uniref:2OG-Fe(II) oxygenase n=1 Tax=Actinokineospora inagensis TaxID=103730 RepID=UPI00040BE6DD|nr:2OG-Fe(II) oxygenase [Actinokineospora inagensis]
MCSAAHPADSLNWTELAAAIDRDGFALTPPLLTPDECAAVRDMFDDLDRFRSTVVMARHQFGEGVYRYFAHPLPDPVARLRAEFYPHLARVANTWATRLGTPAFPLDLADLHALCAAAGQHRPTPLILRYGPGGYNCLHQDLYGEVVFPLQLAIMLNTPDADFTGGENVFVEQRPRAQSRPMVARPTLGQGMIFTVRDRPVPSPTRTWRRVTLRHGVSEIHTGSRHTLALIFHDAE